MAFAILGKTLLFALLFITVYYDSWNSIWKAVFQDGKTLFHAIWCECDRIKEKIKKNLFNWINR